MAKKPKRRRPRVRAPFVRIADALERIADSCDREVEIGNELHAKVVPLLDRLAESVEVPRRRPKRARKKAALKKVT